MGKIENESVSQKDERSNITQDSRAVSNDGGTVDLNTVEMNRKEFVRNLTKGLVLALMSGSMMTTYNSMIKMMQVLHPMQVLVVRGLLQMIVMFSAISYNSVSLLPDPVTVNTVSVLTLCILTGGVRNLLMFWSVTQLPLGDYTTILSTAPVFVMLGSLLVLRENCGIFRIVGSVSLLSGMVLIIKPPIIFNNQDVENYNFYGYLGALMATCTSAAGAIFMKLLSRKAPKTLILLYLGLASSVFGIGASLSLGKISLIAPARDWMLAISVGVLGLVQQYFYTWALQIDSPARVTTVRQVVQTILSYVIQMSIFHSAPGALDLVGAGLVTVTVVVMGLEEKFNTCCTKRGQYEECEGESHPHQDPHSITNNTNIASNTSETKVEPKAN